MLPKQFAVKAPNERVWGIIEDFFNDHDIIWADGKSKRPFTSSSYGQNSCICLEDNGSMVFWNEQNCGTSTYPFISLEDLLCGEFKTKPVEFQLAADCVAQIEKDKVTCEGFDISFDTVRQIAEEIKNPNKTLSVFAVKTPNEKIFNLAKEEIYSLTGKSLKYDFKEYSGNDGREIYITSEGSWCSMNARNEDSAPLISLEELLSFKPPVSIKINAYKVEFRKDSVKVGCKTIANEKILELKGLLPK